MAAAESKSTSLPAAMRPASGRARPAMQSSKVDFPAPEGPKRIVMPGGTSRETSRTKEGAPALRRSLRICAASIAALTSPPKVSTRGGSRHTLRRGRQTKSQAEPEPCGWLRRIPAIAHDRRCRWRPFALRRPRFPPTISTTPNSPSVCAKLSTMAVTTPGNDSGRITRQNVRMAPAPSTAEASKQFSIDAFERRNQRLHRERKAVQHRRQNQPA